ncbi:MAG: ATP-binding protein, partial [bacterium]|nr:ATP-binding protein [bacterium]
MKEESTKTFLSRLPRSGHVLVGREKELGILDNAWNDDRIHILTVVARGGVGKTALVNEWLNLMKKEKFRGAEKVYCWSFYSQGTSEDRQISSDEFLYDALKWFGDTAHKQGSPSDKGKRLARLVREQKALLILDGMEPLQYPPGEKHGQLKDQGVLSLLEELALYQPGLCMVTTRLNIKDIDEAVNASVKRIFLDPLTRDEGAELLSKLGVRGSREELENTAEEFNGHALALNLLGSYL